MTGDDQSVEEPTTESARGPTAPDGGVTDGRVTSRRERMTRDRSTPVVPYGRGGLGRIAWPALPVLAALAVAGIYLATHPYPAYGAGLYLRIAEEILAGGYALPDTIPGYTAGGVPFAYPPLVFYLTAVLLDFGADPLALSRFLPAALTVAHAPVAYRLAREFLPTRRQAGLAATLLAVTPDVIQWHLSAGGMVRGFGFLLSLIGLLVAVRVFRDRDRRFVPLGAALFALTVLTHPVYTAFFGLSWLVLYLGVDRSLRGLFAGAVVAGGGIALAAPWWLRVVSVHGPDVFFAAAGTHSGLGGGLWRLLDVFVFVDVDLVLPFYLLSYAAVAWWLSRGRYLLPAWFVATGYVVGKDRFLFVMGSMMAAQFLVEGVVPWLRERASLLDGLPDARRAGTVLALSVVVLAAAVGGLYSAGALDTAYDESSTLPAFMDEADREAMRWAATNTSDDARFVVLGDAAEWFPLFADRPILVGYWGVEWTSPEQFDRQVALYENVSTCPGAACVSGELDAADVDPDYLYVQTGTYTVRGQEHERGGTLVRSLVASPRYEVVHENRGVVVFRVGDRIPSGHAALDDVPGATPGGG
jgi:hypothetical protein